MSLSFAPDRRSLQTTYYHFNDRGSGNYDRRGLSQTDALALALRKIYIENFPNIDETLVMVLVTNLINDVPIPHTNLIFLAAANSIVYQLRYETGSDTLTPVLLETYVQRLPPRILSEVTQTAKGPEEVQMARARFKVTLLRYILYIQNHVPYRQVAQQVQVVS